MKLLNKEKVIWKSLGSLTNMKNGKYISERDSPSGDIPVVSAGKKPTFYTNFSNCDGNVITIAARGTAGHVMYFENPIYLATAFSIQSKDENEILTKFIYYFLKNNQKTIYSLAKGGAILQICTSDVENIQIPIPPLSEQQRIVDFLDKLTELQTELQTEHKLRKEQYAYYRDLFLDFDNEKNPFYGEEYYQEKIKNIILKTENKKWKDDFNEEILKNYHYLDISSIDVLTKRVLDTKKINAKNRPERAQKIIKKKDVIFSTTRPTQMKSYLVENKFDNQIASSGFCVLRCDNNKILPEFLYLHINKNDFLKYVEQEQQGGAYPMISDEKIKNFIVSIPKVEIQDFILKILMKMEEYANGLNSGLPKLMELEKQRFDYYLNYLMDFENN